MDDQSTTNEENTQNAPAEGQQISEPENTEEQTQTEQPAEAETETAPAEEASPAQEPETIETSEPAESAEPAETSEPTETAEPADTKDVSVDDEPTATEEPATEESAEQTESTETPKNDNPNAKWYVVHTYSGHENKVALTLKQRVESEHLEDKILDVLVPMQDKIEIKSGKKVNIKEKIFPGYILVKMVLDDISWLAVRTTQGVTSFVGMGNKPTPISDDEVQTIVKFTQTEAPMYKQVFIVNDTVKIVDGPFADFIGKIDSVDQEKGKVRVLVSIFGRETPVELDFLQIKKI